MSTKHVFNRVKDRVDFRDFAFPSQQLNLPAVISIQDTQPPIYDQGQLGSCTANGTARAMETVMQLQGEQEFTPSRLFIYFNSRMLEHDTSQDAGAQIRDAIKASAKYGACNETTWPYDVAQFAKKPSGPAYAAAKKLESTSYYSVQQNINAVKSALLQKLPVVFGITVYASFESDAAASNGIIPMPAKGEEVLGGHCITATGVNDTTQQVEFANSWGTSWGKSGYGYLPYAYFLDPNLTSDLWVISKCK